MTDQVDGGGVVDVVVVVGVGGGGGGGAGGGDGGGGGGGGEAAGVLSEFPRLRRFQPTETFSAAVNHDPYNQRGKIHPNLSSLRLHIHLPHRSGRSFANPMTDRPTDWEEDSEDRRCDLRSQPHCCHESQTRSTLVSAALTPQCQRTIAFNVSTVSTEIPGTNWTYWTPSDQLHHSDRANRLPSVHLFLVLYAADQFGPSL
ncbi:hypothetical protein SprV_0100474000 [Sparganum proliferum]